MGKASRAKRAGSRRVRKARPVDGFSDYDLTEFGLPPAAAAELDSLAAAGMLPEGFTAGFGDVLGDIPPGGMAAAREVFPGGWEPGWYWRCGRAGCRGGETIGSPALIAAIGACTGC